MVLALLAFLGGLLTIVSPCILPVLPFVFAKTEQSFVKSTLPLLIGMALTFAGIATLAAVGGGWAVRINAYGRVLALILLGAFGVALLSTRVANAISRPFVALGNRMLQSGGGGASVAQSLLLGAATGLLWAPCAGPILGLILTGAAINGANTHTTLLLFMYALGAIASLALATLAGTRVFAALKRSIGAGEWVRRGLGVAVLVGVLAISLGWDTGLLTRLSYNSTNSLEQSLIDALPVGDQTANSAMAMQGAMTGSMNGTMAMTGAMSGSGVGKPDVEGELPPLDGATGWLNSAALTKDDLRGKVVLIDFWTYSCINCLRALPYVKAWYEQYREQGLIVIGVHAPEFAFEKDAGNVRRAMEQFGVRYPVALDNDYAIWRAFNNRYWPAHYFIDAQGQIRGHHFGEGHYDESERLIRSLLREAGRSDLPLMTAEFQAKGIEAAADETNVKSPETYVGYARAENFASTGGFASGTTKAYTLPMKLSLNQWALGGKWTVGEEQAVLASVSGSIAFRFRARDLHLVLGPSAQGKPVRYRITIDGQPPGRDHGSDVDEHGAGTVHEQRLYQLIRQSQGVAEHTFAIEFLDPGVHAYAFTFG